MIIDCSLCPEKQGCCCGPTNMHPDLIERHRSKIQGDIIEEVYINPQEVFVITEDFLCIFLDRMTRKCLVYTDPIKPEVCQKFGTQPGNDPVLMCPYFKPDGKPRRPVDTKRLRRVVKKQMQETLSRKLQ